MIKTDRLKFIFISALLLSSSLRVQAQSDTLVFEQVRSLANFYEYLLNSVGSDDTPVRDKEVIINESFKKVFMDQKVQIEDDLLPDRQVITNKNVTSYLRDVDFFFRDITFDFQNLKISQHTGANDKTYYQVAFESLLKGTTLEGLPFERRNPRYLEINQDSLSTDLKIVSVYSTKVTRDKELKAWWEKLSNAWKSRLIEYIPFDSIAEDLPLRVAELDSLDFSNDLSLLDITPLQALKNLSHVNLENTQVVDLTPLRYASRLTFLNVSNTPIFDLRALQYFKNLKELNIANTLVVDLTPISALRQLKKLDLSLITTMDFTPLMSLTNLESLNASQTRFTSFTLVKSKRIKSLTLAGTEISNLEGTNSLSELTHLNLDQSKILSLQGIENHPSLTEISISGTNIRDLGPLTSVTKLKKVTAENTPITERLANQFMRANSGVAVITNSRELTDWWANLSEPWRNSLTKYTGKNPGESELARLFQMDSLTLDSKELVTPKPIARFKDLVYLDFSNTTLDPSKELTSLKELETVIAKHSNLTDVRFAAVNNRLSVIDAEGSQVSSLEGLQNLKQLDQINLNNCPVSQQNRKSIEQLIQSGTSATIIFRTDALRNWRDSLTNEWAKALGVSTMTDLELHKLTQKPDISIDQAAIGDFAGLSPFINLKILRMNQTNLRSLAGIEQFHNLKELTITNSPLEDISTIRKMSLLKVDFSNTAIEDLDPFANMQSLTQLNCSGTQIRRVKDLENLTEMEMLDVSNTQVFRLDKLSRMKKLKKLICYNTKLRAHEIEDFEKQFPDCEVIYY